MKNNERKTAFILAAGLGTRLREMTSDRPKAMVEMNGKPLLEHVIEKLISQNFNHFVINVHHFGEKIIDYVNSKRYEDVIIEISDEREFLYFTGGAILKALPYFENSKAVLIHNVDIFSDYDFQAQYDAFIESDDAAWLFTQDRNNKSKVAFDINENYVGTYNIETKVFDSDRDFSEINKLLSFSGLHIFKPEYFKEFELKRCHIWSLYKEISKKRRVKSVTIEPNYWYDLGTPEQLKNVSSWLLSQE